MTKEEWDFLKAALALYASREISNEGRSLHFDAAYAIDNFNQAVIASDDPNAPAPDTMVNFQLALKERMTTKRRV